MSLKHLDRKQAKVQKIPREKQGRKKDVTKYFTLLVI